MDYLNRCPSAQVKAAGQAVRPMHRRRIDFYRFGAIVQEPQNGLKMVWVFGENSQTFCFDFTSRFHEASGMVCNFITIRQVAQKAVQCSAARCDLRTDRLGCLLKNIGKAGA